ncbi:dTDP-4-amino-4,6-dideoxy-D-galactose acyltransferase [Actinobacillus equuli]|uniref:TDP-fucosamine acetyltransferase n=1 Tax=Actinobacillus equuli TaxID=718 RepID=A0AAX3FK61_ACTEU|nr:dTDP-4-amino-4,6-dideoxy-D-galactose acyltransferase [Actinobacillus equuli]AIZ79928.1 histone acetyltransferase [Actinobacillus equuli subsp. equuli]WGE44043.1 dTDP-4-amino-4,6-dideoxy-D-galactose acyltransferase [Actinobacillus equuli subsp. equuli]VEE90936.1 TDP-fucosamine acetyltransferase [Actinobacillus equuli]
MQRKIAPNQWLSEFFGRDIYEIKVAADDIEQIRLVQQQGFQFVEGELDFCLSLVNFLPKMTAYQLATEADITSLQALFGTAFPMSRFRAPWFSAEENQRFYQTWISNAVRAEFDDVCLVLKTVSGQIQGGISVRVQDKQARVGLLAVAPSFRRQGIASQLLQAAINWAQQQGAETLAVATQTSNLNAIRLYQKLGASLQQASYWFCL